MLDSEDARMENLDNSDSMISLTPKRVKQEEENLASNCEQN